MASMVEDTQVHKDSTKCDSMLAYSRQIGILQFYVRSGFVTWHFFDRERLLPKLRQNATLREKGKVNPRI